MAIPIIYFLFLLWQQPEVLREKLSENEKLMKEMSLTWEEKLHKTGKSLSKTFLFSF
jgi:hypothetical protein